MKAVLDKGLGLLADDVVALAQNRGVLRQVAEIGRRVRAALLHVVPQRNQHIARVPHDADERHIVGRAPIEQALFREVMLVGHPARSGRFGLGAVELGFEFHEGQIVNVGEQMLDPRVAGFGRADDNDFQGFCLPWPEGQAAGVGGDAVRQFFQRPLRRRAIGGEAHGRMCKDREQMEYQRQ